MLVAHLDSITLNIALRSGTEKVELENKLANSLSSCSFAMEAANNARK